MTPEYYEKVMNFAEGYRTFLDHGKTERECASEIVSRVRAAGYKALDEVQKIKPGDKVYAVWMKKSVILFRAGSEPMRCGMKILGAHIDSPRLDIKQNPLYESEEKAFEASGRHGLAYLDTHYYGGVKKYQWVTLPLAIHGVIVKKDGTVVNVVIGEDENDPVFCISDLLIHLSSAQLEKKASAVVEGEKLDVIVGSLPIDDDNAKDAVKANVLRILKERYDIEEKDFLSAELEVVPAGKARNMGIDSGMVLAYGQDDRVCAYASLEAFLSIKKPKYTCCCILVDKEEIGSVGATGMQSRFFENAVAGLIQKKEGFDELVLRECLASSVMLSSDVSAAYDSLYGSVFEPKNSAFLGKGMVFNKYTGSRGKSGSNDANPEFIAAIRKALEEEEVSYQTAELGRVDAGGGGTIAYIMALYGMQVVDCGVAVLSMHAPWEVTDKRDLYETFKGYCAFLTKVNPGIV